MKRTLTFLSGIFILLTAGLSIPAANAQTPNIARRYGYNHLNETRTTPFNLVSLAYRGTFSDLGLDGYFLLEQAYELGTVTAEDVVETAVDAGIVSPEVLDDEGYIFAVEMHLEELTKD